MTVGVTILNNKTKAAAFVVMCVIGILVLLGKLQPSRAFAPVGICWVLAAHSADMQAHRSEIIAALEAAALAGARWRAGKRDAAIASAEACVQEIGQTVREVGLDVTNVHENVTDVPITQNQNGQPG